MESPVLALVPDARDRRVARDVVLAQGRAFHPVPEIGELKRRIRASGKLLVLLDLDMDAVGADFFKDIMTDCPEVLVIGLSQNTFHPELEGALRTNLFAVVAKPVDEQELLCCLRAILESSL